MGDYKIAVFCAISQILTGVEKTIGRDLKKPSTTY